MDQIPGQGRDREPASTYVENVGTHQPLLVMLSTNIREVFTITDGEGLLRAFFLLKAPTNAFTFETPKHETRSTRPIDAKL